MYSSSKLRLKDKWATQSATGCISKGIYIDENKDEWLIKGNLSTGSLEPYSEVIASVFIKNLKVPCVEYSLIKADDFKEIKVFKDCKHISICKRLSIDNLIQFGQYVNVKYPKYHDRMQFLKAYIDEGLDLDYLRMILYVDAFIGNEDRHFNNLDIYFDDTGMIRNAPLLDFGASLLYNVREMDLKIYLDDKIGSDKSKPFEDTHFKQMEFIEKNIKHNKVFQFINKDDLFQKSYYELKDVFIHLSSKREKSIKSYLEKRFDIYIKPFMIF